jgi:hypothetical protein
VRNQQPTLAAVQDKVFLLSASFGSAAEPQGIGVASSAQRAEELAGRHAKEGRYAWRRPAWIDERTRFTLETEPLVKDHD